MKPIDYTLYGVTDPLCSPHLPLEQQVEQAILGGMTMVQLRDKGANRQQLTQMAHKIRQITHRHDIPLIINDHPEVAAQVGADGVHLGQGDVGLAAARKMLPRGSLVGVSVANLAQAQSAQQAGADYLGVGAMVRTPTKPEAELVSRRELRRICEAANVPVVIIGGIDERTVRQFADEKIAGIAVVSALFGAKNIREAAGRLSGWRK